MIKTLLLFAYLLILALLGSFMLVGAVAGLVRLFRRLGPMLDEISFSHMEVRRGQNSLDLKRLGPVQEFAKRVSKKAVIGRSSETGNSSTSGSSDSARKEGSERRANHPT